MGKDQTYYDVASVLQKVHQRRGPYLSADDLESLGIELSGMDIETGRPADSRPQFCDLYPSQEFDKLFEKVSADLHPYDEGRVYDTAFGIGMDLDCCLRDMGMFNCWNPSDHISAYRARG